MAMAITAIEGRLADPQDVQAHFTIAPHEASGEHDADAQAQRYGNRT
jgi:hypothetical protein